MLLDEFFLTSHTQLAEQMKKMSQRSFVKQSLSQVAIGSYFKVGGDYFIQLNDRKSNLEESLMNTNITFYCFVCHPSFYKVSLQNAHFNHNRTKNLLISSPSLPKRLYCTHSEHKHLAP